jgi:hypothetical protein
MTFNELKNIGRGAPDGVETPLGSIAAIVLGET